MTKPESILEQCDVPIVKDRKYWLVRTDSGAHYDDFTMHNYISLGWDYITKEIFYAKKEDEVKGLIFLQEKAAPTADDDEVSNDIPGRVTSIYNKLKRFIDEIKIDDVVVIPSKNSDQITIGIIESDVVEDPDYAKNYLKENPSTEITPCPYSKRRHVNWVKTIRKEKVDVYLTKALSSHHAISDVSDYSSYINRELYSIYQSGDMIHSIIRAGHPNGVSFQDLRNLLDILENTLQESSEISGIDYNPSELQVKLNIHSPGIIEIVGSIIGSGLLVAIGMLVWNHVINGGETKFSCKVGNSLEISTESKTLGTKGRSNEKLQLENDYSVQVLKLAQEAQLRQLSQSLDMNIPEVKTQDDILTIDPDCIPDN